MNAAASQPQHLSKVRSKDNDNDKATTAKKFCVVGSCGGSCSHGLFQLVAAVVAVAAVDCGRRILDCDCCSCWLWLGLLRSLIVAVAVVDCGCCGC